MAFCINCGQELPDDAKFCAKCGRVSNEKSQCQRENVYVGTLHKCPNCGEVIESFVTNCPSCGYELRGAKNSVAVSEFVSKIEAIEKSRPTKEHAKKLLGDDDEITETDLQKIALIRSFVIPNTKEDLIEFLILASSNINLQRYNDFDSISDSEQAVSDAWEAKFEQAYEKARLSFGNSPEFKKVQALYDKKTGEVKRSKKKRAIYWVVVAIFIIAIFFIWFCIINNESKKIENEKERLQGIVEEIYDAIEEGNYDLAKAKTATLVFSGSDNDEAEKWDATRNELLSIIDTAENDRLADSSDEKMTSSDNGGISEPSDGQSEKNDSLNFDDQENNTTGGADTSVEITVQGNEYLDIKEFGWYISGDCLVCITSITNNSSEFAIEYPSYRITAYDENNRILGTEEQVLSVIYPQQDFSSYSVCFELSEKPAKIEVTTLNPEDYNITDVSLLDYTSHKQMTGKNITVNNGTITGEIYNPNDYAIDSAMVTIVFKNEEGEIVCGEVAFIGEIPAGGTTPFDVSVYTNEELPSNCEVYAYFW